MKIFIGTADTGVRQVPAVSGMFRGCFGRATWYLGPDIWRDGLNYIYIYIYIIIALLLLSMCTQHPTMVPFMHLPRHLAPPVPRSHLQTAKSMSNAKAAKLAIVGCPPRPTIELTLRTPAANGWGNTRGSNPRWHRRHYSATGCQDQDRLRRLSLPRHHPWRTTMKEYKYLRMGTRQLTERILRRGCGTRAMENWQ